MTVKASGQPALIWLRGSLRVCADHRCGRPVDRSGRLGVQKALGAAAARHARRAHTENAALAKSDQEALKSSASTSSRINLPSGASSSAIPPSVANANAELTSTLPVENAPGLAARTHSDGCRARD